jgi:hypothetical protein
MNRIDGKRLHSNSSSGYSSNASNKITTSSEIKTESNSERSNSEYKTMNSGGRSKSANEMSTCVRVQIRNRGKYGRSIEHAPGIPSTAVGSKEAAIAAIAYRMTGIAELSAAVITFEFTANRW